MIALELAKTEKSALKKLDEMNHIIEESLMVSLKPDEKVSLSYDFWE